MHVGINRKNLQSPVPGSNAQATTMVRRFGTLPFYPQNVFVVTSPAPIPDTMLIFMHIAKPQCLNFVLGEGGPGNGNSSFSLQRLCECVVFS